MIPKVHRTAAVAGLLALALVAPPAEAVAAPPAQREPGRLRVQQDAVGRGVPARAPKLPKRTTGRPFAAKAPVWPSGSATVPLTGARRRAGKLPVSLRGSGPDIKVDIPDRAATAAAGVRGMIVRLAGPAEAAPSTVHLDVDYSGFRDGFSGGSSASLGLVRLDGCVPLTAACTATPVRSTNNVAAGVLGADVPANATLAVQEAPTGSAGDYAATPLRSSSTWQAGGNAGDFTWGYPLRVPAGLNGPTPDLGIGYSAQSVDGEIAASNNQPSWLGEGFDLATGAIERKYVPCSKDMGGAGANNTTKTGDLCWRTDNATMTLNGQATELLKGGDGRWHGRSENGDRIELRTGAANGDQDGQWWVVTEPDGTQYWFGRNQLPGWVANKPVTNSAWTVPVYGNNTNEPCHAGTFAASACNRAWRWNLDYVVDTFGNTMSFWYGTESNSYAKTGSATSLASYVRGGWLDRIDYGTRSDTAYGTAPMQVDFGEADRCVSAGCGTHDAANWPDTPWTLECTKTPCYTGSPTFWTGKRLGSLTTKVAGKAVEQWTFTHSFPNPGDTTRAGLWLENIGHKGLAGTADGTRSAVSVPDVHFVGVQKPNRVDATDNAPAMNWWRVASIETETGGSVNVTYSGTDCVSGSRVPDKTALYNNTLRCFPGYWTPDGASAPQLDFFHKYVVTDVTESDLALESNQRSVPTVTHYDYLTTPAWRYTDDDGLIDPKDKTWSQWRGYGRVRTTVGTGAEAVRTETVYFRGMDGDKLGTGNRSVSLAAAGGAPAAVDSDTFAGMAREELSYQDAAGAEISSTVTVPWRSETATATRTVDGVVAEARYVGVAETRTRTALDGGRGWRATTTRQGYDGYGMVTSEEDLGDDAVTDDQSCTLTDYARANTPTLFITSTVSRKREFAVDCAKARQGGLTEADVVSDTYTLYDGGARGAAPSKGAVTQTDKLAGYPSRYVTEAKATFDAYGRSLTTTDIRGNTTTTTYTPTTGGPVTGIKTVNQLKWTNTTTLDPSLGLPTNTVDLNGRSTRQAYDALGRVTAVWLPNRASSLSASMTYRYLVRKTGGTATVTGSLNPGGDGYRSSIELFDGQTRPRQTQAMEGGTTGGRVVNDTFYDSAGRSFRQTTYVVDGGIDATNAPLVKQLAEAQTPALTLTAYDGAGRVSRSTFKVNGVEKFRTTTGYGGDRTDVTPPAGSPPSSTFTDALGHTTRLRRYRTALGGTDADDITYAYDRKGRVIEETDNAGNAWTYGYDFSGNQTSAKDPDAGETAQTFNDAGDLLTSTNAEHKVLVFGYDGQGRKTSARRDTATGPLEATWTFDTDTTGASTVTALGQQIASTRYVGGAAYKKRIDGFNDMYQPTGETVYLPATETGFAGSYSYAFGYSATGVPVSTTVPALGALPREKLTTGYNALGQADTLKTDVSPTGEDIFVVNGTGYTRYGELGLISRRSGDGKWLDTAYEYETGTRRINRIHTTRQTTPSEVADYRLYYDAAGNVVKNQELVAGDTQCFGYDHAQRLTEAWTPAGGDCAAARSQSALGGPAPYWNSYGFDAVGNRTSSTERTQTASTARTYLYPAAKANQPHALQSMTTSGAGTATYTYDKDGNTLTRPANGTGGAAQTLTWNPDGTLATSTDAGGTSTYVYDAEGNRLLKHEPSGTTLSLPGQELKVLPNGQSAATRFITHAGQTVAVRTAAGLTWQVDDQQGTGAVEVNAGTQAVVKRWFTPFGAERGPAAAWVTDRGLVGGARDGSGLTHLGAREYDPTIGRFISVDPVITDDDLQQMQGYNYASASPVTLSDPDGRLSIGSALGKIVAKVAKKVARKIKSIQRKKRSSAARSIGRTVARVAKAVGRAVRQAAARGAIGRALGRAVAAVAAAVRPRKSMNLFESLLNGGIRLLGLGPTSDNDVGCGLSKSEVFCRFLWGSVKRILPEAAGPFGCSAKEAAHCWWAARRTFNAFELSAGWCLAWCVGLEFQGGVLQLTTGPSVEPGFGGGWRVHTTQVDEQAPVSYEFCEATPYGGACVGAQPKQENDGDWRGTGYSVGPEIGVGNPEPVVAYNVASFDFRDMSFEGPQSPLPGQLPEGLKRACEPDWVWVC